MKKLQQLKQAIRNPPPERLAKVEYQSHFMQILGVSFVCGMLIYKGLWYIIFAFIFSLGISYSQGMGAYQKYKAIMQIKGMDYDIENDKSPTRRRDYVIKNSFGSFGKVMYWFSIALSVLILSLFVGIETWVKKLAFVIFILPTHIIIYYFVIYYLAVLIWGIKKK